MEATTSSSRSALPDATGEPDRQRDQTNIRRSVFHALAANRQSQFDSPDDDKKHRRCLRAGKVASQGVFAMSLAGAHATAWGLITRSRNG
jgi:hypothetical protein